MANTISKVRQAATGATNRLITAKLNEVVSVRDFGAVGDGIANDTEAIQFALDSGATHIYVPAGTYKIVGTMTFGSDDTVVYGDGAASVLVQTSTLAVTFNADNRTRCGIRNLTLNGPDVVANIAQSYTQSAFRSLTSAECFVLDCYFSGWAGGPVFFQDATKCLVAGNVFTNAKTMPLATDNFGTADITFWKSCVDNIIRDNVSTSGASYNIILQTVVAAAQVSLRNKIINNTTSGNLVYGILVYNIDGTLHSIKDTIISGNNIDTVYGFYNNPATGNKDYGAGIYVLQAEHTVVTNNIVRNTCINTVGSTLTPAAIAMNAISHGTITNNVIEDAVWYSIWVSDTNQQGSGTGASSVNFVPNGYIDVTGNNIYNSTKTAIVVQNKHQVHIIGNVIHKVTAASMSGIDISTNTANYPTANDIQVIGNAVKSVTSLGINVSNCLNAVVTGNKVNAASTGFFIDSAGTNLSGNTATACTVRGMDFRATGSASSCDALYVTGSGVGALCSHDIVWGSNKVTGNTTNFSGLYAPWLSATYNPPSLGTMVGTTTTITATGAALGDFAEAGFSLDLQGITMSAYVSATDTITVRFFNGTAGTIDLASGTLSVRFIRR